MEQFLNWLGLPASIGVAFLGIRTAFNAPENIASKEKKAGLSNFLRSADWTALPLKLTAAFREVFEAVFGASQFSAKCLRRSISFSLIALFTLLALGFLKPLQLLPDYARRDLVQVWFQDNFFWLAALEHVY